MENKSQSKTVDAAAVILSLMKETDMYGYEIIAKLNQSSDITFQRKEGSIYPILHTLSQHHYVKSYLKNAPGGSSRRYYRLTKSGENHLKKLSQQADTSKNSGGIA